MSTITIEPVVGGVKVTSAPAGTARVHVAFSTAKTGGTTQYDKPSGKSLAYSPGMVIKSWEPKYPWIDVQALSSSGSQIGGWAGRVQPLSSPQPPPPPPPVEPPPPLPQNDVIVGVDTGGWGGSLITEVTRAKLYVRTQQGAAAGAAALAPGKVASVIVGGGGTIGNINPATLGAEAKAIAERIKPLAIEVLNEPGGKWFWSDPTNYAHYRLLCEAVYKALSTLPKRPLVLASWDGGNAQPTPAVWGHGIKAAGALAYCDGVTVHPYGAKDGHDGGALGGRKDAELAHAESGLPVYVTEVGWPQAPTGDSQAWTEQQQADNIVNFVKWARSTSFVKMVIIFNGVDYSGALYGIEHANRAHKLAFAALAGVATPSSASIFTRAARRLKVSFWRVTGKEPGKEPTPRVG